MNFSPDRDEVLQKEFERSLRKKSSLQKSNEYKITKLKQLREKQDSLQDENSKLKEELLQIKQEYKGKNLGSL